MGKHRKQTRSGGPSSAIEVNVEVKILIQECHSRTGTICDKRYKTFSYSMGNNFEKALSWLGSGEAEMRFGDICEEAVLDHGLNMRGPQ